MLAHNEWIDIAPETHALAVPGGALIRTFTYNGDSAQSEALCFLPLPPAMLQEQFEEWLKGMNDKHLQMREEEEYE